MDKEYLITSKPLPALLSFSLPMMLGNLFQQFYTMADSIIVGRFIGENALAAVGASFALTAVFIAIAIGGGMGASVITSGAFGARNYRAMKLSISTSLIIFLIVSIILAAFGLLLSDEILIALNTPSIVLEDAVTYLNIYFLGLPFLFMYNVLSSVFNSMGKSRIPLYLLIFSSILNVVLDIVMVASFGMGVAGAAWATLIAQGISAVISFMILLRTLRDFDETSDRLFSPALMRPIAGLALPSILQQSTVSIGMMLVQSVVNSFGAEALAGFSAAMRLENIAVVPMAAIGNAMSSYTAQNIGAGKLGRVVKGYHTAYGIVAVIALIIMLPLELFSDELIYLFLGDEGTAAAMDTGISYITFMGWFFIFIGMKMITDGLLRGSGDMKVFTIANIVNLSIRVLVAFIFAPLYGIEMVWIAVPIGWAANWIISYWGYHTGKWKSRLTSSFHSETFLSFDENEMPMRWISIPDFRA